MGAERLILVKHGVIPGSQASVQQLVEQGMLDQAFAQFAATLTCPFELLDVSAHAEFSRKLIAGPPPARMA